MRYRRAVELADAAAVQAQCPRSRGGYLHFVHAVGRNRVPRLAALRLRAAVLHERSRVDLRNLCGGVRALWLRGASGGKVPGGYAVTPWALAVRELSA